jgi:hypothetical protein
LQKQRVTLVHTYQNIALLVTNDKVIRRLETKSTEKWASGPTQVLQKSTHRGMSLRMLALPHDGQRRYSFYVLLSSFANARRYPFHAGSLHNFLKFITTTFESVKTSLSFHTFQSSGHLLYVIASAIRAMAGPGRRCRKGLTTNWNRAGSGSGPYSEQTDNDFHEGWSQVRS